MSQSQVYFSLTAPMSATVVVHESDRMFREIAVGKRLRIFYRGLWVGAFDIEKVTIEDTDEGLVKTVQGRGPMAWMEKALVWSDVSGASEREFTGTYAEILLALISEAQARDALPAYLVPTFTATTDSEGKAISGGTVTLRLQVGSTLLDYVRSMWERGIWVRMRWSFEQQKVELDWIEPPYGRDLTEKVKFRPGINAQLVRRTLETTEQATVFLVRSGDAYLEVSDTGAVSTWGRKEELFYADQAGTNTEAQALAQDALATRKEPHLSIELNVYDHDQGPRVFVEYGLADLVSVWNEHDRTWETYRIVGFFVDFDDAGRGIVRLELNREPRDPELAQARLVAKTGKGKKHELSYQSDPKTETKKHNTDSLAHRNLVLGDTGGDVTGTVSQATVVGLQGRPVSDASPSLGQALVWDGTQWAPGTVSGGSGGNKLPGWFYSIDDPPAIPSVWDDEFEGSGLDTKWTFYGTVAVRDHALVATSGKVDQSAPSGTFTITAHVIVDNWAQNYNGSSIFIVDSSGKVYRLVLEHDGDWRVKLQRFQAYPNWSWVANDYTKDWKQARGYLKLEWDGSGVTSWVSRTGREWHQVGSHSGWIGTPTRIGADGMAEWFRVMTP